MPATILTMASSGSTLDRTGGPAWTRAELAADPHAHEAKADKVRGMFAAISHRYDLNNRVHSFGRDRAWRRAAVRLADPSGADEVLDAACGTGDLARAFAAAGARRVVGLDFTPEMLALARAKPPVGRCAIEYVEGDAMNLPFADASFDIVSIAFGIRNVSDPGRALREFRRVLRPGGRLVILEFSRPRFPPIAWINDFYCSVIMPRTATLLARDRSGAYRYLPRSVTTFLSREAMADAMRCAGFDDIHLRPLTFGVCVGYRGSVSPCGGG